MAPRAVVAHAALLVLLCTATIGYARRMPQLLMAVLVASDAFRASAGTATQSRRAYASSALSGRFAPLRAVAARQRN
jgi:hypothetical protein